MTMDDYSELYARLPQTPVAAWLQSLPPILSNVWQQRRHGDWEKWQTYF
ncbi:MAG TPA: tRNA 5-methoxyuridine(34)/uridine 5-oxyacetic acid(34) synthase CmoB, partial [Thiothrix sp.]|nr:tRNA 5-methoxyuridine(34)/uridine 5-oxyacetic acid(34) synthase CmoB [Thiothrix sp.]